MRGLAYRGSVEGTTYKHRDAKLATKCTDGKQVNVHDGSLTGAERDKVVCENMGAASSCATGGGKVVFGKVEGKKGTAPAVGAAPVRRRPAERHSTANGGSAPG